MEHSSDSGYEYGLWSLVIFNTLIILFFAFSFFKPRTKRDWRTFGGFSAFIVALFVEMYGFPLSIYFLSGWLGSRYPAINAYNHDAGHLWHTLFKMEGNPHFDPFHIASNVIIILGFFLLATAWPVLYRAQRAGKLAVKGPYAKVRHPQYIAFVLIMFGFLLQWPTIPTLVMFPILVIIYIRLSRKEENETRATFGKSYDAYAEKVPAFFPHLFSNDGGGQKPKRTS